MILCIIKKVVLYSRDSLVGVSPPVTRLEKGVGLIEQAGYFIYGFYL